LIAIKVGLQTPALRNIYGVESLVLIAMPTQAVVWLTQMSVTI
jgi:hypothetical protein